MCGIIGIIAQSDVNIPLYEGLSMLQHRGQDAAGLVVCHNNQVLMRKDRGLVRDVFSEADIALLKGKMGIGHVRYPTSGSYYAGAETQPLYNNYPYGICLAYNGNLVNNQALSQKLKRDRKRHFNTTTDSELLINMLAHQLQLHTQHQDKINTEHRENLCAEDLFYAITGVNKEISGGYAVVGVVPNFGIFAFRDPNGIRPLCLGRRQNKNGRWEYCVSSESVVFNIIGYKFARDVAPGEAIFITQSGELYSRNCSPINSLHPCLFEYVYLARPDSQLDSISVYQARVSMGASLARKIKAEWPNYRIDAVMPIPESARASALELSYHLDVPYREGLVKNRYIGRTFIMPTGMRSDSVQRKLNVIESEFQGRNVLLVDDSIVRGTTSRQIVALARAAGARRVYFASAAPPIRYQNVYGINIPTSEELICAHLTSESEVCAHLGCDRLFYQDLREMCDAINTFCGKRIQFEDSCFSGKYITNDIDQDYLDGLEPLRTAAV